MKSAKVFLAGMYLYLALSIAVPVGILCFSGDGWNAAGIGLLVFYLVMIVAVQIAGWVCAAAAVILYRREHRAALRRGWKLLKLWSIPFYVLNFIYSLIVWLVLVGASRGVLIFLVPIPVVITCMMVVQSGCVGICYIMLLQKRRESQPSGIHYALQLFPVLDAASTVVLLKNYEEEIPA